MLLSVFTKRGRASSKKGKCKQNKSKEEITIKERKSTMSAASSHAVGYALSNPVNPHMSCERVRIDSFRYNGTWQCGNIAATPEQLAKAGFFYMGRRDRVQCWYCNGALEYWDYDDDPWTEHAKWYPSCEFTLCRKGDDFVSGVLSQFPDLERPDADKIRNAPPEAFVDTDANGKPIIPPTRLLLGRGDIRDPQEDQKLREIYVQSAMVNNAHVKTAKELGFKDYNLEQAIRKQYQMNDSDFASLDELLQVLESIEQELDTPGTSNSSLLPQAKSAECSNHTGSQDEHIRLLEMERQCKICFENQSNVVFVPCGHLSTCETCARRITCCPICRSHVREKIKTYTA